MWLRLLYNWLPISVLAKGLTITYTDPNPIFYLQRSPSYSLLGVQRASWMVSVLKNYFKLKIPRRNLKYTKILWKNFHFPWQNFVFEIYLFFENFNISENNIIYCPTYQGIPVPSFFGGGVWHGRTYSNQHFGLGISSSPSPPKNRARVTVWQWCWQWCWQWSNF
jgi:hypothetical protein